MNEKTLRRYKEIMEIIESFYKRLADFIESQKEGGYLLLLDSSKLSDDKDTVFFKMGQNKFIFQMTAVEHTGAIVMKTYKLAKYPEKADTYMSELDILCEGAGGRYAGILSFRTPRTRISDWNRKEEDVKHLEDFATDYFFFLNQHIKKLNEPVRESS